MAGISERYNIFHEGETVLTQTAALLLSDELISTKTRELVNDMFDIIKNIPAIGLAAPQIGISKSILVFGLNKQHPRKIDIGPIPYTAMLNPKITYYSKDKNDDYEGCLSVKNQVGLVSRSSYINVEYYSFDGNFVSHDFNGFIARVIQHEYDHLCGRLITEHAKKLIPLEEYLQLKQL